MKTYHNKTYYNLKVFILGFKDLVNLSRVSKKCYTLVHNINSFSLNKYYNIFSKCNQVQYTNNLNLDHNILCDDYFANINEYYFSKNILIGNKISQFYKQQIKYMNALKYSQYLEKILYWSKSWKRINFEFYALPMCVEADGSFDSSYNSMITNGNLDDNDYNYDYKYELIYTKNVKNLFNLIVKTENINKIIIPKWCYLKAFDQIINILKEEGIHIKFIIIHSCICIRDSYDNSISHCTADLSQFKEIKIINNYFRDNYYRFDKVKFNTNTEILIIKQYCIENIQDFIREDTHYKFFEIDNSNINNWCQLKNITSLQLIDTNITNENLIHLKNIESIYLESNNYLTDVNIFGNGFFI